MAISGPHLRQQLGLGMTELAAKFLDQSVGPKLTHCHPLIKRGVWNSIGSYFG